MEYLKYLKISRANGNFGLAKDNNWGGSKEEAQSAQVSIKTVDFEPKTKLQTNIKFDHNKVHSGQFISCFKHKHSLRCTKVYLGTFNI